MYLYFVPFAVIRSGKRERLVPLENLTINRVCMHEVYRRPDDGGESPPSLAEGLLQLDALAMAAFRSRVIAAFKSSAQCIEMAIVDHGLGSLVAHGAALVAAGTPGFIRESQSIAKRLAGAQQSRSIPGGLIVVFDGTVGNPATPFFGVMKAELHEGFLKGANLQATFVENLFLSPKTKLYKIGLFVSDGARPRPILPEGWVATVYDSHMTATQRDSVATYFHRTFLGLELPVNSAQKVKQFYQQTKDFIRAAPLTPEQKTDLYNGLYTYLKVNREPTIQVSRFAETYMDDDLADDYGAYMQRNKFPAGAVSKDLSEVQGVLRQRRFRFPRSITLSGPSEAINDLVRVDTVAGDSGDEWTQITIRGQLESQD
jgi:hypothetical protein